MDLGTSPEDYVALAARVRSELDAIKGDLDALKGWAGTHKHGYTGQCAPGVATAPSLSWAPSDVAAKEVRAK